MHHYLPQMCPCEDAHQERVDDCIGIYVHIPYCVQKCPYCDFNSYGVTTSPLLLAASASLRSSNERAPSSENPLQDIKSKGAIFQSGEPRKKLSRLREEDYVRALISELDFYGQQSEWQNRVCRSIFFGGGTPSLFAPSSIAQIIESISKYFSFHPQLEVTLEANPGTVHEHLGQKKLSDLRAGGVNRVSLGAQSFSETKLRSLGRFHSGQDIKSAIANLKHAGFSNFNIDLIFGIHGEELQSWQEDLQTAVSLEPSHISAYCLTIEVGTEFHRLQKKGVTISAEDDLQARMYEQTQGFLKQHSYQQYEISNYALSGCECAHNFIYWSGFDYLGLGAGSHSFVGKNSRAVHSELPANTSPWGRRWSNIPGPDHYIERALQHGDTTQQKEYLSAEQAELEFFMLGLRRSFGVSFSDYQRLFGRSLESRYDTVIHELKRQGLLEVRGERLSLSEKGFLFADGVFSSFAQAV